MVFQPYSFQFDGALAPQLCFDSWERWGPGQASVGNEELRLWPSQPWEHLEPFSQ